MHLAKGALESLRDSGGLEIAYGALQGLRDAGESLNSICCSNISREMPPQGVSASSGSAPPVPATVYEQECQSPSTVHAASGGPGVLTTPMAAKPPQAASASSSASPAPEAVSSPERGETRAGASMTPTQSYDDQAQRAEAATRIQAIARGRKSRQLAEERKLAADDQYVSPSIESTAWSAELFGNASDAKGEESPSSPFDTKDMVFDPSFDTQELNALSQDPDEEKRLSAQQQKQAKLIIKEFVKEMVKGRSIGVVTPGGATKSVRVNLTRRLDALVLQAGGNNRRMLLQDIVEIHSGRETPADVGVATDDLTATVELQDQEYITFRFADLVARDTFAMCTQMFMSRLVGKM